MLKQIAERGGSLDQLDYWDDLLITHGKGMMDGRLTAIKALNQFANPLHSRLSAGRENLALEYVPSIPCESMDSAGNVDADELRKRLRANHRLDIQRGVTTIGAHRDDFRFLINGLDLSNYGSRGQIRTALQALKLGEVEWMRASTGSSPVLLLDETLAELDEHRRKDLLGALGQVEQALLTTADLELFHQGFLDHITRWEIESGQIREWVSSQAGQIGEDTAVD